MESSPLILAHDHARAASIATQSSETTVAINEHALAAGEFSKAASRTSNAEALRTLRLLEQHHQRLSKLLRYPTENPPATTNESGVRANTEKLLSTSAAVAELYATKSDLGPRSSSPHRAQPSLHHPRRLPPRDLNSSIASNLASARGIRTNNSRLPLSPSISTQHAPGSLESIPRVKDGKRKISSIPEHSQPSWLPPTQLQKLNVAPKPVVAGPTAQDEGFSKFYSAVENILYKLSAPLAFAGLPLTSEELKPSEPDTTNREKVAKERSVVDPDLSQFISRAALRASARDGHSATESFYVVPSTGHTASYAQILSFDEKEKRRREASAHSESSDLFGDPNEEDDFVDAQETPMPPSPSSSRTKFKRFSGKQLENKVEELGMENSSLKLVVDKLSKRLHTFEMSAQNNSMALQESMRLIRESSPVGRTPPIPRVNSSVDEGLKSRVVELEEKLKVGAKEAELLWEENKTLREAVKRYRERWERLKAGAKTRREGNGGKKDDEAIS
ncbi:hypothetical protein BJ878DRAFT_570650 [Calycina marina]|uniref:Uncharacterized protein n=1 Tax=Calycina marina TaxID=1763456 RepID=A0A9P7YWD7_9HELO|nr:hypothetical protein BJ878DRAFT_570650 [Calycina marina]